LIRSTRAWRTAAVLAGASLVLTACGGGDGDSTDEPGANETTSEAPEAKGDGTLRIGSLLPQTGDLAFLGPPEFAGVDLAIQDINAAGGVLGNDVEEFDADSGDGTPDIAGAEVDKLFNQNVDAIIGAAASGVSVSVIDKITGSGVVHFSPANTAAGFDTYDDNGLYFRTAPSDVLQGQVLGNLIAEDGNQTLGMIVLNDSYGTGLAKYVTEAFEAAGGEVVAAPTYNTGDTSFTAQISEVLAADPDAIALITFDEVTTILPGLFGKIPADKLYFVDGNLKNFGDAFDPGSLTGAKGTLPGLSIDSISDFTGQLDDYSYAAESYDATILIALAALAAGSTDGTEIAAKLQEVSGGTGDGEKCSTYADCAAIIVGGGVADYDGISGPITFDEVGDPTEASIGIYQYGEDNTYSAYEG
jgi:branched-chain amino acid transport system substrate-binding protein